MNCELWAEKLDAYVDGEMKEQELTAVEDHLRTCPNCASEALTLIQLKRTTRSMAALRFTPPPELRRSIAKSIAPKRYRLAFLSSSALAVAVPATVLVLAIAVSSVVFVRRAAQQQDIAQLLDMHVAALASPNPVDVVSSDRHTVKPWFQGKLPFTFNLPELAGSPYKLDGGRLIYFRGQPSAQLIYELRKHEFSVFIVQASASSTAISAARENGFSTESWSAAGLHYVVISDAGAGDVHALGDLIRNAQR